MHLSDFKARLSDAFKSMRKEGLVARQAFSCCGSCAGYDLATELKEKPQAVKDSFKGCAFYTKQGAPPRDGSRDSRTFKGLYLSYGPVGVSGEKDYGLPTEEVGAIVKRCVEQAGLEVDWDGTPEKRIFVRFSREAS